MRRRAPRAATVLVAGACLPPGKTDHIFWDDDLTGFGLRLRGDGKAYVAQFRVGIRTRRMKIGDVETLTADQARAAARKILASVALGGDPQAERIGKRRTLADTLRATVGLYLDAKARTTRPRTQYEVRRYLLGPFFAALHDRPVDTIARRDVAAALQRVETAHGAVTTARARTALSAFYAWAMGQGLAESNPVIGTSKPIDSKPRERVLTNEEIALIWRAGGDDDFGRIVKLCLLTAARRSEVGGMCWSELAPERGLWTIPAARSKNGRQHALPLPPLAWDVIGGIHHVIGRDNLFGDRSASGYTRWSHGKRLFDAAIALTVTVPWTLHDIRRSVATGLADLGVQPHVIEAVLNHQSGTKAGVAGIYNRSSYEREVAVALALWADHVRALVDGGGKKVVMLRS